MYVKIFTLLCLVQCSIQRSTPESDSYVAGVVEFGVSADVEDNLARYLSIIQEAAQQNVDIIVFPELTLTNSTTSLTVPINGLLKDKPIPALFPNDYDTLMVAISKAARDNQMYVVINGQEILDCSIAVGEDCPEDKVYLYNTNVVFNREGAVIDRYRKINLFGEFVRTPGKTTDVGIFETDFGVRFGHFVCFDLMFQVPAVQVVEKYNLTDIVFTTMWFSEAPYLVATGIQEAYAYAMNVNFLGAGANNIHIGSGGSGIYSGKAGALISIMPGTPTTRLLVSRVPKIPGQVENISHPGPIVDDPAVMDQFSLIGDPSIPSHVSKLLTLGSQEIELVDKEVSCKIKATLTQRDGDVGHYYRAFILDGVQVYSHTQVGIVKCGIVACRTKEASSCPYMFNRTERNIEVTELDIEMISHAPEFNSTLNSHNILYFPSTLKTNKFFVHPSNLSFKRSKITNAPKPSYHGDSCIKIKSYEILKSNKVILQGNDVTVKVKGNTVEVSGNDIEVRRNVNYGDIDINDVMSDLKEIENKNNIKEEIIFKLIAPQRDLISFGIYGRHFDRDASLKHDVTPQDIVEYYEIEDIIYGKTKKEHDSKNSATTNQLQEKKKTNGLNKYFT